MKLTLVLTHGCPLRCRYCYAGPKVRRAMSPELARQAVELGLSRARLGVLMLCFMGGEALLEPDLLLETLRHAREEAARRGKKVFSQLTTSGVGMNHRLAASLAREKVQVTLSLDGDAPAHDPSRPLAAGGGSHARGLKALRLLRSAGLEPAVNAVVHSGNVDVLPRSAAFLLAQGFRRLTFSPDYLATWSGPDLASYRRGLSALGRLLSARSAAGAPVNLNPLSTLLLRRSQWWRRKQLRCGFAEQELAVAPDGAIYPCERLITANDDTAGNHAVGHLLEGGLDRKRQKAVLSQAKRLPSKCRKCSMKAVCSRSCGGTNLLVTGDAGRPSPSFCALELAAIEVADSLLERVGNVPRGTLPAQQVPGT